jgi:hypothetical protein
LRGRALPNCTRHTAAHCPAHCPNTDPATNRAAARCPTTQKRVSHPLHAPRCQDLPALSWVAGWALRYRRRGKGWGYVSVRPCSPDRISPASGSTLSRSPESRETSSLRKGHCSRGGGAGGTSVLRRSHPPVSLRARRQSSDGIQDATARADSRTAGALNWFERMSAGLFNAQAFAQRRARRATLPWLGERASTSHRSPSSVNITVGTPVSTRQ